MWSSISILVMRSGSLTASKQKRNHIMCIVKSIIQPYFCKIYIFFLKFCTGLLLCVLLSPLIILSKHFDSGSKFLTIKSDAILCYQYYMNFINRHTKQSKEMVSPIQQGGGGRVGLYFLWG